VRGTGIFAGSATIYFKVDIHAEYYINNKQYYSDQWTEEGSRTVYPWSDEYE